MINNRTKEFISKCEDYKGCFFFYNTEKEERLCFKMNSELDSFLIFPVLGMFDPHSDLATLKFEFYITLINQEENIYEFNLGENYTFNKKSVIIDNIFSNDGEAIPSPHDILMKNFSPGNDGLIKSMREYGMTIQIATINRISKYLNVPYGSVYEAIINSNVEIK